MSIMMFITSLFVSPPEACPALNIVCDGYEGKAECPLQVVNDDAVFVDKATGTTMKFTNDCIIN